MVKFTDINQLNGKLESELMEVIKVLKENTPYWDRFVIKEFSEKELREDIIKDILSFLKDWYDEVYSLIHECRKKGKEVEDINFILMSIPLKIKIFKSSLNKKDFEVIFNKLVKVETELQKFKEE